MGKNLQAFCIIIITCTGMCKTSTATHVAEDFSLETATATHVANYSNLEAVGIGIAFQNNPMLVEQGLLVSNPQNLPEASEEATLNKRFSRSAKHPKRKHKKSKKKNKKHSSKTKHRKIWAPWTYASGSSSGSAGRPGRIG